MEARVKTLIWVQAFIRRTEARGYAAVLVIRGDEDAGAVLIKVNRFESGWVVYTQVRDEHGNPAWLSGTGPSPVSEADANKYVERQRNYDADLWVIEIEDPKNTYGLDGAILKP